MLERKIEKILNDYYKNEDSEILVIDGARQVGKSFIVRKTASSFFKNYIEINLKYDFDGPKAFLKATTLDLFYMIVGSFYGNKLGKKEDTIIFLDEIQVYPHLLTLLKALKQDNKYRYIASGSLLGITLKHTFIPMGSICEIKMYPLDFEEFLWASGVSKNVIEYLKKCYENKEQVSEAIHDNILLNFKKYLICGGLPAAVELFLKDFNIYNVRRFQTNILNFYIDDASQYDIANSLKIKRIYELLPSYMENKVKRIKFNEIDNIKKVTYQKYKDEFDYLINSGCALGILAISDPKFPLIQSASKNLIKLYYNDVGLLSNILFSNFIDSILNNDKGLNLGSLYETAVAMELIAHNHKPFYFDSRKVGEVDFIINDYNTLSPLPIEVKSGNDQNNFKAIPKLVDKKGNYKLPKGIILGNKNIIKEENDLLTLPIYMVMFI